MAAVDGPRPLLVLFWAEEEEEEEEEEDSRNLFLLWPRSSSTTAVVCPRLVTLVHAYAVSPSFVSTPTLLGIMDGMDQKDSTHRALVVDSGSSMCRAGFACISRAVFLYVVVRPIVNGWYAPKGQLCSGSFAGIAPRAGFLPVVVQMLVIMAGMDQKERYVVPCRKLALHRRSSFSLSWCRCRFLWSRLLV